MNHGVVLELLRCVKNASAIVGPNNRKLSILKKRTPECFFLKIRLLIIQPQLCDNERRELMTLEYTKTDQ